MFSSKKVSLMTKTSTSSFLEAAQMDSAIVSSENGAKKYSTTGNDFVDQFAKTGEYKKPRTFDVICADQEKLWATNKIMSICFIFYLRIITRVVTLWNGSTTAESAKGAELKHEPIMRMIWLHMKQEETFWKNIQLFISVGSWKDIFTMLSYDLIYNGWENRKLNWKRFGDLILSGLENENQRNLLLKYFPQIKAESKCKTVESQADTIIAKWICSLLFGSKSSSYNYKKYRQLKVSGTAHEWQQLISQQKFDKLDFSKIHGRALSLLVKSKFLFNQELSVKYSEWITKPEVKTVKFTGFVHELFDKFKTKFTGYTNLGSGNILAHDKNLLLTVDKQFNELVKKTGEKMETNFIVVRDTSGSMMANAIGTSQSCFDVAKALALFFSEFLTGSFANSYIEFSKTAILRTWKGNTPTEKWFNDNQAVVGDTRFLSVINLFAKLKLEGLSENEFPKGILCISDMEFNPSDQFKETNLEATKRILLQAGFSNEYVKNFTVVMWNLQSPSRGDKFESHSKELNTFYFGGYSASIISFLTGKIHTAEELVFEALNQPILKLIAN